MLLSGMISIKKQRKHNNIRIKDGNLLLDSKGFPVNLNIMGVRKIILIHLVAKNCAVPLYFFPLKVSWTC